MMVLVAFPVSADNVMDLHHVALYGVFCYHLQNE